MKDQGLFLSSLSVIDDVTERVCRRHRLAGAEAEDFQSEVRLHFLQHDCGVLRRFEGRSTLATYVTVIIQRLYLNHRNRQWGRWRPSAEARRIGPIAVLFERLVSRDGWAHDQAFKMLRVDHSVEELGAITAFASTLSKRAPARRTVREDEAHAIESPALRPDADIVRAEQDRLAERVQAALDRAQHTLPAEDALILKMRFEDAMPVAEIARVLHLNQKRLYRSIQRLLARLRASLEHQGVSRADVRALTAFE